MGAQRSTFQVDQSNTTREQPASPLESLTMAKEVMMSMRMAPEAGASLSDHHAPPPAISAAPENYSSNYKGVMLCDRPGIEVSREVGGSDGTQAVPFLSAVSAPEQLGLNPIRNENLGSSNKGGQKPK